MANCSMCTPDAQGTYVCNSCIDAMKNMLRKIAYPHRGTEEEGLDIYDAAKMIQLRFSIEQLK